MKKSNIILYGLITFTLLSLAIVSADIISINSGGNNEIVISDKYIEGFFFDTDIDSPTIQLISPEQGTQDTDGVIRFQFIPSDRYKITSCSLYSQLGLYTTHTSILNNQTNVIEVVGVDENHPLYFDDLQWHISCIDEYFNIGTSETRNLDTKSITGGAGITQQIIPSDRNPLYLNLFYQKVWNPNEENLIKIETFNQESQLYSPQNIEFEYNEDLTLKSINVSGESYAYFIPNKDIKPGIYQIKLKVIDERTISQIIEIEIKGEYSYAVKSYKETLKKYQWCIYGIILFLIILLICIFVIMDQRRKRKKQRQVR